MIALALPGLQKFWDELPSRWDELQNFSHDCSRAAGIAKVLG
jgi:hypothetical protein